ASPRTSAVERPAVGERIAELAVDADEVRTSRQDRAERASDPRRECSRTQILLEKALVDAFERTVRGRAVEQMLPELCERRARAVQPERLEILPLADLGVLSVADRAIEELREAPR